MDSTLDTIVLFNPNDAYDMKAVINAVFDLGSKYIHTDLVFAWPTAEIAVMGADGAINLLYRRQLKETAEPATMRAQAAKAEYTQTLHLLSPATQSWQVRAYTCSALTGEGIAEIWSVIEAFRQVIRQ
jgi:acetyl-CoA carboxylase carboxyltransferase component